jgi:glucose-6-phosphate 1-dehydrogenase
VETFAAVRLMIDSWRWQGVPFYIRAGKSLPVTCTEVVARLRKPPAVLYESAGANYWRFRIGPIQEIAVGVSVMDAQETGVGQTVELLASRHAGANERDAYERVLSDALIGDRTLFAREDYAEEAWRIVDPVLSAGTPIHFYEPGTWGPSEAAAVSPPGGWLDPIVSGESR